MEKFIMETSPGESLRRQAELLAALSTRHRTLDTRKKLADEGLSVNAYAADCCGFVYVGSPPSRTPAEPDLATIFEAAKEARVTWLMFDREAAIIDGLPVFDAAQSET
jgi:hypothetical protein